MIVLNDVMHISWFWHRKWRIRYICTKPNKQVTNSYKSPSTINTVTKCLQHEAPPENDSYSNTTS